MLRRSPALVAPSALLLAAAVLSGCIPEDTTPTPARAAVGSSSAPAVPAPTGDRSTSTAAESADSRALLQAVDAVRDRLKGRARDVAVNLALGNLFVDNGRYVESMEYYRDAARQVQPVVDRLRGLQADAAAGACPAAGQPIEALIAAAQSSTPADSPAATGCWREAARQASLVLSRYGNAWYLSGNPEKAAEQHALALSLHADQPESLFFRGARLLEASGGDPARLAEGRAVWERLLKVAPEHPRAGVVRESLPRLEQLFGRPKEQAVAAASAAPQGPGALPAGLAESMAKVEITPEMARQLDERLAAGDRLLTEGRWQEALDTFKGVMPLRPDARVALGMGVALRELGKPTAERVLLQAGRMPGADGARARYELALHYLRLGDARGRELLTALQSDAVWGERARAALSSKSP